MIGVIAKPDQVTAVEEFFQLFKTPWEFYQSGHPYDVVIATTDAVSHIAGGLVLLYSAAQTNADARYNIAVRSRQIRGTLRYEDAVVPIYGQLATFDDSCGTPCVMTDMGAAGVRIKTAEGTVIRLGYDLFHEVELLLSVGQPVEFAHSPTLDIHIQMLRNWILGESIPLLEIPPTPAGYKFCVCLTHDIDFIGIRHHVFDHTMWGYLYRSTCGALYNLLRRRISLASLFAIWRATVSLPFVYWGHMRDFWSPFEWYLRAEDKLPATYFVIPFKGRPGQHVPGRHAKRRASAYGIRDLGGWPTTLLDKGCEIGVHGIDAWHSADKGGEELAAVSAVTRDSEVGIRMHWLLRDANTASVLEQAGYAYDSSVGYNETVGYHAGTTQVFRPLGVKWILELPLHIQDGALFLQKRLDLSEPEAWKRCEPLIEHARRFGGVLTVLWHDRSHAPERLWGNFYLRLINSLVSCDCWFGTAGEIVRWFRKRRQVSFETIANTDSAPYTSVRYDGADIAPPLTIRIYRPSAMATPKCRQQSVEVIDLAWRGQEQVDIDRLIQDANTCSATGVV